jgi:undecaprenyl-diphosphatase
MSELFQIIILSIIQGITEFLPISSSAHLIFIPNLFGWKDQGVFLNVSMHFGSLLAISYYYIKNNNLFRDNNSSQNHIGLIKIIIGSLPVLFFGFIFYDYITENLRSIEIIGFTSIFVACIFLFVEYFKKSTKKLVNVSNLDIFIIGLFQSLALIPGTSRAAIIILGALLIGYTKKDSIIIALVLSFPVILIAMIFELSQIELISTNFQFFLNSVLAVTVSFLTSFYIIKFFINFINTIGFYPFMIYRIVLGLFLLFALS